MQEQKTTGNPASAGFLLSTGMRAMFRGDDQAQHWVPVPSAIEGTPLLLQAFSIRAQGDRPILIAVGYLSVDPVEAR